MGGGENSEVIIYVRVRQPWQRDRSKRNGGKKEERDESWGWEDQGRRTRSLTKEKKQKTEMQDEY